MHALNAAPSHLLLPFFTKLCCSLLRDNGLCCLLRFVQLHVSEHGCQLRGLGRCGLLLGGGVLCNLLVTPRGGVLGVSSCPTVGDRLIKDIIA